MIPAVHSLTRTLVVGLALEADFELDFEALSTLADFVERAFALLGASVSAALRFPPAIVPRTLSSRLGCERCNKKMPNKWFPSNALMENTAVATMSTALSGRVVGSKPYCASFRV